MDQSRVLELIGELSDQIDTLESSLEPFTGDGALNKHAESLPLLDRAKLYTTTAYAIESLLYNHLSLAGEDAKSHPVMTELNRVKQYFEKIRDAEDPNRNKRPDGMSLDKSAAKRFIKHGLAGNEQYDIERAKKTIYLYNADERTKARVELLRRDGKIGEYTIIDTPYIEDEASKAQADGLRAEKEAKKRQRRREKKDRMRQKRDEMKKESTGEVNGDEERFVT